MRSVSAASGVVGILWNIWNTKLRMSRQLCNIKYNPWSSQHIHIHVLSAESTFLQQWLIVMLNNSLWRNQEEIVNYTPKASDSKTIESFVALILCFSCQMGIGPSAKWEVKLKLLAWQENQLDPDDHRALFEPWLDII